MSENVISTMVLDNVSAVVKLDKTILTLGSDLIENQGIEKVPVRHLVSNVPGILEVSLRKMGHWQIGSSNHHLWQVSVGTA